jgi:hypothetical protein
MAEITKTLVQGSAQVAVTVTTLGASDTLVYKEGVGATLVLNNVTAGALTPLITGADATTYPAAGIGNVDTSGGFQLTSIAAGATVAIELDNIKGWLKGVITVTGGTAIEAQLLEYA